VVVGEIVVIGVGVTPGQGGSEEAGVKFSVKIE
jgi:hypothetical protein